MSTWKPNPNEGDDFSDYEVTLEPYGRFGPAPVAWLHILDNTEGLKENEPETRITFSPESPFGVPGVDHSKEFPVTSIPLYSEVEPDGRKD